MPGLTIEAEIILLSNRIQQIKDERERLMTSMIRLNNRGRIQSRRGLRMVGRYNELRAELITAEENLRDLQDRAP